MFIRGSIFIIATIVILFFYSPTLTGVTIGGIIPVVLCGAFFGHKINHLQKKIQDEKAKMSSVADESFGNVRTVSHSVMSLRRLKNLTGGMRKCTGQASRRLFGTVALPSLCKHSFMVR